MAHSTYGSPSGLLRQTLPAWLLDDEFQPVANDVIAVSSSEINYFVLFVKYVAEASVVQLGVSGSIGNYLPYYVYICDGTLE